MACGMAEAIGADAQTLSKTIYDFNSFAESGEDYAFGRSAESMKAVQNALEQAE